MTNPITDLLARLPVRVEVVVSPHYEVRAADVRSVKRTDHGWSLLCALPTGLEWVEARWCFLPGCGAAASRLYRSTVKVLFEAYLARQPNTPRTAATLDRLAQDLYTTHGAFPALLGSGAARPRGRRPQPGVCSA